nr:MAG TPA: hypothetical protein [Caudoviricetes sp.]
MICIKNRPSTKLSQTNLFRLTNGLALWFNFG